MSFFRGSLVILSTLFTLSLVAIAGISAVTSATDGRSFPGAEWLVGLGFGAMWMAFVCPVLIVLLVLTAWFRRRAKLAREADGTPPRSNYCFADGS